ncbi:hypothetical protein GYMLUDRAFT_819677 [Collybiopsis luxurians FD-317 M1]|uniref:Uncharacterized protein n=1 Tax=Collybiopsis luxurians FD-317 M1 TaxID=944289 RepID=A0A0D0CEF6_9AGAR|nr:hypothetical protein GYMLUDRAFT_819677 [Collybiopsis luxurians FD-317 M1]
MSLHFFSSFKNTTVFASPRLFPCLMNSRKFHPYSHALRRRRHGEALNELRLAETIAVQDLAQLPLNVLICFRFRRNRRNGKLILKTTVTMPMVPYSPCSSSLSAFVSSTPS